MHAGSIQVRLLGILAIGVICSFIACTGGAAATPQGPEAPAGIIMEVIPSATEVDTGGSFTVTAKVSGAKNTEVTWSVDGIPNGNALVGTISGSGATVTYTAPATEGSHTLTATSLADYSKQGSTKVSVKSTGRPVSVALSPGAVTLAAGGSQAFTATVSNTLNLAVTWAVDGIPNGNASTGIVSGAGNTVTYLAPSLGGSHTLTATSVADPAKSASAGLTITAPTLAVGVSISPASLTLATGASAQFTATVTGTDTPGVTWTVDGIAGGNGTVGTVSGTGNTITYTAPASGGSHRLTATSAADASKSASATLTVQAPAPVAVGLSPGSVTVTTGTTTTFTASVTGTTNTGTAWAVDGIADGNATVGTLSGTGNARTYLAPASAGTHAVTATSLADSSKAATSTVTVQAAPATTVALSPTALTLAAGSSGTFTATVSGAATTGVAWTVDGIANGNSTVGTVSGSGSTITYTAPSAGGTHTLVATSLADTTKSASATLTVQAVVAISLSPATSTVTAGSVAAFSASVTGTTNTGTTWAVDGVLGGNATTGTLSGTGNSRSYTAPATAGTHTITATSAADASKSATASVTVQAAPTVSVSLSPTALTLATGATSTFTATVSGTTTSGVTWMVDGIANGNSTVGTVTGSGATVTYTAPATGGVHTLVATSVADATKTASATLTVQAPLLVSVSLSPGTSTVTAGSATTFTASVSGTTNTGTTWAVDGVLGGNATTGTLSGTGNSRSYLAPSASGTHVITATSQADPAKVATSTVTVQASTPAPSGVIVAPDGLATNPGTLAAPTTLEGARALIQKASRATAGTLRVLLRGGIYPRTSSFTLGSADSGSSANPVEWAAYPNETPRIIGGVSINPSAVKLVDGSDPNWSRLDPVARPFIYAVDLSAYKASLGTLTSRSDSGGNVNQSAEVFVNGLPLTLARYPKAVPRSEVNIAPQATIRVSGTLTPDATGDYAYKGQDNLGRPYYQLTKNGIIWSIAASATGPDWRLSNRRDLGGSGTSASWGTWDTFAGPAGAFTAGSGASGTAFLSPADGSPAVPGFLLIRATNGTTQITAPDPRMSRWRVSEAMYYGLGYYSWSGSHSPLTALDPASGSMVLSTAPTYGFRTGQPFFIYNLLEELTEPGDCFIDRVNARLYLRPVGDLPPTEVLLSTLQSPVVQMQGCQQVTWKGVTFEAAKDRLVYATGCTSVAFNGCKFRNAGGYGLLLSGTANLVDGCDFRQLGQGGIMAAGGDRMTLTPSRTVIQNSEFQYFGRLFWTYQPAIRLYSLSDWAYNNDCIGITIQNNEIHHSPHSAILYSGNEHTIRYNHIHHATEWANDSGVIYTTGREWGTQGNLIQFNLIRDCGSPLGTFLSGIYIDGIGSGVKIEGNILYRAAPAFAVQHNGGRDVVTQYNIFYGHWYGVDISNVAFEFANNTAGSSWDLLGKLLHFNYQSPPWSTAYPHVAKIPNTWSQIQGTHWLEPEGSACYGNLQFGPGSEVYRQHNSAPALAPPISWFTQVGSNLTQVDPLFVDPKIQDFRLQPASPMYGIPGFPGIDAAKIGIQK